MLSLDRFLIVSVGAASSAAALAQSADVDRGQAPASVRVSVAQPPAHTIHSSGSAKAVLVPFGPYITQVGVGAGGADVSELYSAVGYTIYGFGMQASAGITVADDFTVPGAASWTVSDIKWISYQTGAPTSGSITAVYLNLWNTPPAGQLPGGQWVAGGNQLQGSTWTGVYRVLDTTLGANNRALIEVSCGGGWVPPLGSGSYWLEASADGSILSGPWAPPVTVVGQAPPTIQPWNAVQSVSPNPFAQVLDPGSGSNLEPADFVWQIEGSSSGGIAPFCTSKTSSLGCTPTLATSAATADKSGSPSTLLTAGPVPGGPGKPGILIYAKTPPSAPVLTPFGFLCLSGFARAGAFPAAPGGVAGTCSGIYVWDLASIAAGTGSILVGDVLRIQAWYRDPGFAPPGNANFTHGVDAVAVVVGGAPAPGGGTITPGNGGEGTPLIVTGSNFGTNPANVKLLLADGEGFADVRSAAGNSLIATVFKVGNTGVGPVTVIVGNSLALPNQTIVTGITSNSSLVRALTNGAGTNFSSFNLSPSSANTVSVKSGSPLPGGISLDMTPITGTGLLYRLSLKTVAGDFSVYQGRIDFVGVPTTAQRAQHFAEHLNASFGTLGVSASPSGSNVRVSMAGAAYGGIVVAGI